MTISRICSIIIFPIAVYYWGTLEALLCSKAGSNYMAIQMVLCGLYTLYSVVFLIWENPSGRRFSKNLLITILLHVAFFVLSFLIAYKTLSLLKSVNTITPHSFSNYGIFDWMPVVTTFSAMSSLYLFGLALLFFAIHSGFESISILMGKLSDIHWYSCFGSFVLFLILYGLGSIMRDLLTVLK